MTNPQTETIEKAEAPGVPPTLEEVSDVDTTKVVGEPLTGPDLEALKRSYITPELADRAGLRRVSHNEASKLLGRYNDADENAGIVFPYRWPGEETKAYRVRRDHPPQKQGPDGQLKDEGKYLSKTGQGGMLYVGPDTTLGMLWDPKLPIIITEGEKKCLALHRVAEENQVKGKLRYLAVGLPGVYNWLTRNESGSDGPDDDSRPIQRLNHVLWEKREVTILFDANAATNTNVATAQDRLARELKTRGAKVKIGRVPALPGVNGIDDLLGSEGPDKLLREILPGAQRWKPLAGSGMTDADNAKRLVKLSGDDIRFISDAETWAVWRETHWVTGSEAKSAIMQKALETAGHVNPTYAYKLKSRSKLENMVALAQNDPKIRIPYSAFDADPLLLNVANGTIDLRTGQLRPHDKNDLITKMSPIRFDPDAQCPQFEKFLGQVFESHPDVTSFLKRAIGYSLTGQISEQVVFFLHGSGRNGKGTLISIIQHVLGHDYSHAANIATFMKSQDSGQGPNEGLAALAGQRFVSAQEPDASRKYDIALLKTLTGGDTITTHKKFEHQFSFDPTHKLWIATNPQPVIPPDDPAIWARVKLIPFAVSFKGKENTSLLDDLKKEASGILNWMIQGALEWQESGLGTCPSVDAATRELREANDQVAQFIADECEVGNSDDHWAKPQDLYYGYKDWADEHGRKALSMPTFMKRLDNLGYEKVKVQGNNRRKGLRLKNGQVPNFQSVINGQLRPLKVEQRKPPTPQPEPEQLPLVGVATLGGGSELGKGMHIQ